MKADDILILTNEEGKCCRQCGKYLPLSHFYKMTSSSDGYQNWCIKCQNAYKHSRRVYRLARKAKIENMTVKEILDSVSGASRQELQETAGILRHAAQVVGKAARK